MLRRSHHKTCLSLGLLLLLGLISALRLDVLVVHGKSLVDLGLEGSLVLSTRKY